MSVVLPSRWCHQDAGVDSCAVCERQSRCFLAERLPDEGSALGCAVRRYLPVGEGDLVFRRDARFGSLFVVRSGSVKAQRVTRDGGLVVTGFYLPGDVFGLDAIGGERYPCDAVAVEDTELCELEFDRLLELCAVTPELQGWLVSCIGCCLRQKDADLSAAGRLHRDARVLRFFVELHERLRQHPGAPGAPGARVPKPMKKRDIALFLQMAPETLSRTIGHLRDEGLLEVGSDFFILPDPARAWLMTRL